MRTAVTLITSLVFTLAFGACDAPTEHDDAAAPTFREAPMLVLYLSQYDASIVTSQFSKMVNACPSKRKLAITYTRYAPLAGANEQVIGLGFSVTADGAWADCYEDLMVGLGAKP